MMGEGVERPVALNGAQLLGCVPDGLDRHVDRIAPNIGGPGDGSRRSTRQHEPTVASDHIVAKLLLQLGKEALGGKIAGQLGQWCLSSPVSVPIEHRPRSISMRGGAEKCFEGT